MSIHRLRIWAFGISLCLLPAAGALGAEQNEGAEEVWDKEAYLAEQLEPLRPFLGKTYRGVFASSTPDRPVTDVQVWERALNGMAVRLLHSVNEGAYGGETIFMWDEAKQAIGYHYFTTLGFVTVGTISFGDGTWTSREVVQGGNSATNITEVESTGTLRSDGSLEIRGRVLEDGAWRENDAILYEEAPEATVRFR